VTGELGNAQFPRPAGATFESAADLDAYLRVEMPGRIPHPPKIDFTRDEVVLIASGARSSTGYALQVLSVTERGGSVVVAVHEQRPTLGDRVTATVTYPHRLIVFRRPGKPVTVKWKAHA
jgi:hypothetical protein